MYKWESSKANWMYTTAGKLAIELISENSTVKKVSR